MTSYLRMIFKLGDNFSKEIHDAIEAEIEDAAVKWKVNLSSAEKERVLKTSLEQLKLRAALMYEPWDFADEIVLNLPNSRGTFNVPSEEASKSHIRIARTSTGWQVDHDRSEDSLLIADLLVAIHFELLKWARTAAFYGVGSYKN